MNVHGSIQHGTIYQFGDFSFDSQTLELRRRGEGVDIKYQPARLLKILVEHSPDMVLRQTLQNEIWDNGTTVEFEASLNACVNQLRSVLGDSARAPQFIATLPKRGYRFVAPVESESKTKIIRRGRRFLPKLFGALSLMFCFNLLGTNPEAVASIWSQLETVEHFGDTFPNIGRTL